ncbi:hypothetical protein ACQKM2_04130 [Streptomyces sp. NPDC004126]|uniref:hypothetical protein n=1 Tax=Streptomyces sp. NPDC004126 TaxID=3390695 RepID=UPI003D05A271
MRDGGADGTGCPGRSVGRAVPAAQVHVGNFDSDTLSGIDTAPARVTDTVAVGDGPTGVAAAPRKKP